MINLGTGKISCFGGFQDMGVGFDEGLSLVDWRDLDDWWFQRLFEDNYSDQIIGGIFNNEIPEYTIVPVGKPLPGLARGISPGAYYIAMRFAFGSFGGRRGNILSGYSREQVRRGVFTLSANGITKVAQAVDWGPGWDGPEGERLVDASQGLLIDLKVKTDDNVTVGFVPVI